MSSDKRLFLFNFLRGAAAILLALLVATVFIFLSSKQPLTSLKYLLLGPVISFKSTGAVFNTTSFLTLLAAMIPTIFSGLAVCVMFSANQFNLAGEGVIMLGAFVGGLLGIYLKLNTGLHQVVCVLVAAVVGGLIMLIPALLKVKLGASEMVTSLMLNYVIMFVILHFLNFTFADRSKGATQSFPFQATAKIPEIVANGTKLTWGLVIALVFVVIIALFMYRTKWGYAIRMIGINQKFAQYSGMKVGGTIVLSQVIGGVLSGMGGSIEVDSQMGQGTTFVFTIEADPVPGGEGLPVTAPAAGRVVATASGRVTIRGVKRAIPLTKVTAKIAAEKMANRCQDSLVSPSGIGENQMPMAKANTASIAKTAPSLPAVPIAKPKSVASPILPARHTP